MRADLWGRAPLQSHHHEEIAFLSAGAGDVNGVAVGVRHVADFLRAGAAGSGDLGIAGEMTVALYVTPSLASEKL